MNILVLGSEGQIGSPFCKHAQQKGHNIIRFDKKISSIQDLSTMEGKKNLSKILNECDVVLFLAFEVGGSKFLQKADKTFSYISENVRLMENTFYSLLENKKPFLFASSQMANMHHTNYGFLKDLGERYTRALDGWICRFWNVYGYEDPNDPKSHVITDFIHMAKTGTIITRTTGSEERQFLHTDDCSRALLHWCEHYLAYSKSEYIDITSFEWTSIAQVAVAVSELIPSKIVFGKNLDTIQVGVKNQPSDYIKQFWTPQISLKEGIKKLI